MGFFDKIKKKKEATLSEDAIRWNKMFELWSNGDLPSPYSELVGYYGEIAGEGHPCYFDNTAGTYDLEKTVEILAENLPEKLSENLKEAYAFYVRSLSEDDEAACEELYKKMYECDIVYDKNQGLLEAVLQEYANTL